MAYFTFSDIMQFGIFVLTLMLVIVTMLNKK